LEFSSYSKKVPKFFGGSRIFDVLFIPIYKQGLLPNSGAFCCTFLHSP
jgi:hypothetical protein